MICNKTDKNSVELAADFLKSGKICILPTDTVYGFSGIVDLKKNESFETDSKIRKIKGRQENKPFIQLISKPEDLFLYTNDNIPESLLAKWPGALTIIVNQKEDSPLLHFEKTVAFRCPGDEWLRKLIALCGAPVFSTSVNRSGEAVLDEIKKIQNEFESDADLIVCDGDKKGALPSTIVKIQNDDENERIKVIRQGSVLI